MAKKLLFGILSLLSIILVGCSNNDENIDTDKSIVGNWKLIEIYIDPGDGSGNWNPVEDGYTYNFSENGEFTSTRFSECSTGEYSIDSNQLTLEFDCNGFTAGIEEPEGTFIEDYFFESNTVIFVPIYLNCIEGCGWKFEKVE